MDQNAQFSIQFAVGVLLPFIQNPGPAYWEGVKRVISYLGSTRIYGLLLEEVSASVWRDSDAD